MQRPIYEVNLADTTSSAVASEGTLTVAETTSRNGMHPAPRRAAALCSKDIAVPLRGALSSPRGIRDLQAGGALCLALLAHCTLDLIQDRLVGKEPARCALISAFSPALSCMCIPVHRGSNWATRRPAHQTMGCSLGLRRVPAAELLLHRPRLAHGRQLKLFPDSLLYRPASQGRGLDGWSATPGLQGRRSVRTATDAAVRML